MRINRKISLLLIGLLALNFNSKAGNKDRNGQAGAYELNINPFARSSGWGGLNGANIRGVEAMKNNVAGLSFAKSTELIFAKNVWLQLKGGNISLNNLGIAQPLGKNGGVLGVNIMSMTFGEIPITTTENPDLINGISTLGTFKPQFLTLNLAYSKSFSDNIYGGIGLTLISESIPNAKAQGVGIDAGIQYLTGPKDNVHFGIAIRNVGTPMVFRGDGLAYERNSGNNDLGQTVEMRSAKFDLPAQLNISGAYDFLFAKDDQRVTVTGKFTSNAYSKDQIGLGAEYAYKTFFMLRAGYNYESGLLTYGTKSSRTNVYTGLSAGFTFEVPIKKDGPTVGIDYAYRTSNPFNGTHAIGLRLSL